MDAGILWWRQPEQEDLAAVHVAVQSVAPFEEYIDTLQPKFSITAEKAIEDAIAQTRAQDTGTFTALLASLAVRFPEITDVLKETTKVDAAGTTTKESERTVNDGPGALSDAEAPAAETRTITSVLPSTTAAIDPILKYRTAAALMQEVALLSTYVRDAAISSRSKPYIVRLLVTMFPTNSRRGYDAYTTVSFFTKDRKRGLKPESNVLAPAYARRAANDPGFFGTAETMLMNDLVMQEAESFDCDHRPLDVVPLFVTDNIESSLHSDSLERVRDIALAVQGIWGNTRAGGGLRSQREDLEKSLTRNLNSLMTVARLHDNTLQIRLGAMYGNREDSMVPRTFNVTALVLFPTARPVEKLVRVEGHDSFVRDTIAADVLPCSQALYTAQTSLRNTRTGRVASVDRGYRMARRLSDSIHEDLAFCDALLTWAAAGDFESFKKALLDEKRTDAALIWPQALAIVRSTSLTSGTFSAPARDMEFFSDKSYASLIDDGKAARVTLTGAVNVSPARLSSTIRVITKKDGRDLYLSATDIAVGPDGRSATFTFPSVKKIVKDDVGSVYIEVRYGSGPRDWQSRPVSHMWFPMAPPAEAVQVASTRLTVGGTATPAEAPTPTPKAPGIGSDGQSLPISYFAIPEEPKEEKADPEFTLSASSRAVMATKSSGTVTVALKHAKEGATFPMYISVAGCDIVAAEPVLEKIGTDLAAKADGLYKLTLDNLIVGSTITLKSYRIDDRGLKTQKVIPGSEVALEVRAR